MTRIGFYTGQIYDNTTPLANINECCAVINFDPTTDIDKLNAKRYTLKLKCDACSGDPNCIKRLVEYR